MAKYKQLTREDRVSIESALGRRVEITDDAVAWIIDIACQRPADLGYAQELWTLKNLRANQGHSIPVDVELEKVEPPEFLYHGTGEKFTVSIDKQGLIPKSRLYVHLSPDEETAVKVGRRHGKPVIYLVRAGNMKRDGYAFYRSVNGVWLTKEVPVKYLRKKIWT